MTRGAQAALHVFVEGRRTALFRSAYLLCGDRDEAEDLVQTTLVKVVLGARRHRRGWTTSRPMRFPITREQLREPALKSELLP